MKRLLKVASISTARIQNLCNCAPTYILCKFHLFSST